MGVLCAWIDPIRAAPLALRAAVAFGIAGCSYADKSLEGLPCPCPADLTCDPVSNRCTSDGCSAASEGARCPKLDGVCRGGRCCTGCYDGKACVAGTELGACGARGEVCASCDCQGDRCEAGACRPEKRVRQLSVGGKHACLVTENDDAYCWGNNDTGQLGLGDTVPRPKPTMVLTGMRMVSAGEDSSCAVGTQTMKANRYCWGHNVSYALGLGFTSDAVLTPTVLDPTLRNPPSLPDPPFAGLAVGPDSGCGNLDIGSVYCWGYAVKGETHPADCTAVDVKMATPRPIHPGIDRRYGSISGYGNHVCAIDDDAGLWCWGHNLEGQLGAGTAAAEKVCSATAIAPSSTWLRVSAGHLHTCGVQADRSLWCWGGNKDGQLGSQGVFGPSVFSPQSVELDGLALDVSAGWDLSCAIAIDTDAATSGRLYCFGVNDHLQAGVAGEPRLVGPTRVGGFASYVRVATGGDSTCAIRDGGGVWCWGSVLGAVPAADNAVPTRICVD